MTANIDYRDLGTLDLIKQINTEYETILAAERHVLRAIAVGEMLIACKDRVKHGEWEPWLKKNCAKIAPSTDRLYRQLADNREELERKAKPLSLSDLTVTQARELLAKPKPEKPSKPSVAKGGVDEPGDTKAKSPSTSPDEIIRALDADEIFGILRSDAEKLKRLYELLRDHHLKPRATTADRPSINI
jgi:hypothetical protein